MFNPKRPIPDLNIVKKKTGLIRHWNGRHSSLHNSNSAKFEKAISLFVQILAP